MEQILLLYYTNINLEWIYLRITGRVERTSHIVPQIIKSYRALKIKFTFPRSSCLLFVSYSSKDSWNELVGLISAHSHF